MCPLPVRAANRMVRLLNLLVLHMPTEDQILFHREILNYPLANG